MHVHTRVKDKVDAVEGAELSCACCGEWKEANRFKIQWPKALSKNSNVVYKGYCDTCDPFFKRKINGTYLTVQQVRLLVAAGTKLFGSLNQARHTQGHEEPRAPRKPLSTAERERRREARERREGKPDMCYLVGMEGDRTAVKIGHSTNVWRRMAQYQAGNPRKLVVLGLIEGGQERERELHQRFMHLHEDRFVGEWFRLDPAILGVFGARRMP